MLPKKKAPLSIINTPKNDTYGHGTKLPEEGNRIMVIGIVKRALIASPFSVT